MKINQAVIRVLVVDDSQVVVELLRRLIDRAPDMLVVGTARNAREAEEAAVKLKPDLITMDVTLPGEDGIAATRRIMRAQPTPIAVVTARPVGASSETTFLALAAGAVDVLPKPRADLLAEDPELVQSFLRELRNIAKVGVVGIRGKRRGEAFESRTTPVAPHNAIASERPEITRVTGARTPSSEPTRELALIAVGASTGGPPCIRTLLSCLTRESPPVVIVQHMSPHFVEGFASWLNGCVSLDVTLARDGAELQRGSVVLAPADRHLLIDPSLRVRTSVAPPQHGHRPAVDVLFHSLTELGPRAVGVLLTGMGEDGARGLLAMQEAGAITVAQDETSSLVFGMPRAAIELGAANMIANPTHIGQLLARPHNLVRAARPGTRRTP